MTSDESPVAEIEQTEVTPVESPVEVTHEEISNAIVKSESTTTNESEPDTNEVSPKVEVEPAESGEPQQKRRRKGKNYEEETSIDADYASQLDLSCVGEHAISAPTISNAFISKYNR